MNTTIVNTIINTFIADIILVTIRLALLKYWSTLDTTRLKEISLETRGSQRVNQCTTGLSLDWTRIPIKKGEKKRKDSKSMR